MIHLPKPRGITPEVKSPEDLYSGPDFSRLRLGAAKTLAELTNDFVFFTPALLYTHGKLDRDIVQEFCNEAEGEPIVSVITFDKPIFRGLQQGDNHCPDRYWDHTLMAVPNLWALPLLQSIVAAALLDFDRRVYYRAKFQALTVVDPLFLQLGGVCGGRTPKVEIGFFCLAGNKQSWTIRSSSRDDRPEPYVLRQKPYAEVVEQADFLFQTWEGR